MASSVSLGSPTFSLLTVLSHDSFGAVLANLHVAEVCASLKPVAAGVRASAQRALSLPRRVVHRGDNVDGAPHEWLERVCAAGTNVRAVSLVTEADGVRLLHGACTAGFARVVDVALRSCCPAIDVNVQAGGFLRSTPLHVAARNGRVDVVDPLLRDERIDVNACDQTGTTPLHAAATNGRADVVDRLLRDERVDVTACDPLGTTPLYAAAEWGHVDVVDRLLHDGRVDVNLCNPDGTTPLYIAALHGRLDVVDCLLRDGRVDVNACDQTGKTPLRAAADRGHAEVVARLKRDDRCHAAS